MVVKEIDCESLLINASGKIGMVSWRNVAVGRQRFVVVVVVVSYVFVCVCVAIALALGLQFRAGLNFCLLSVYTHIHA